MKEVASIASTALALCSLAVLGGCGGGGGGIASAPTPALPVQASAPPPTVTLAGLKSSQPFATMGVSRATPASGPHWDDMAIRYLPAEDTYEVSVPGFSPGKLVPQQTALNQTFSKVTSGQGPALQNLSVTTYGPNTANRSFTYTSFGSWGGQREGPSAGVKYEAVGEFVYGIPTAPGDVPKSGTASYSAVILGGVNSTGNSDVSGSGTLNFDFLAGTLGGWIDPSFTDAWSTQFLGRYTFKDTVYSSGNTTFSGSFQVPGDPTAISSFEGRFAGPQGAEVMARWQAPFAIAEGASGTMVGVLIGRKVAP